MKKIIVFAFIFHSGVNMSFGQSITKDILTDNLYPKAFVFRHVSEKTHNYSAYADWEKNLVLLDGFIGKAFVEETPVFDTPKSANWFNQFAANHPEKIAMVHFNGRERDPRMNNGDLYSAGHWMYHPGTTSTQGITASQTIIPVNNASVFKLSFGNDGANKNDDIVIVPLDSSGNRLWHQAEQVSLVSKNGNDIEVIRGQYGTLARSFTAGVYIAPHAVGGPWNNNNLVWLYNYAIDGPVDGNGKRCIDVLSDEISSWFSPGGLLEFIDGIQFDIARRYVNERNNREVDQNNDGFGDNFSADLREKYELGVVQFYQDLRTKMGTGKLIVADGGRFDSQRVASAINGIELEGFGDTNDTFRQFSKSINAFNFYTSISNSEKISYVTHKDKESVTEDEFRKRERFVLAASQCLGVGFNSFVREYPRYPGHQIVVHDELYAGNLGIPHWLGAPVGDYIDVSESALDFWSGDGLSTLLSSSENAFCTITQHNKRLRVSIDDNAREATVTFKNVTVPSTDYVFSFDALAKSKLDAFPEETPRLIKMEILGGTNYDNDAEEILGFFSADKKYRTSYYVRDIGATTVDIKLIIEGDANIDLTNFALRPSVQALARAFENGVVLSNPSINDYTFDLNQLFPGRSFQRLIATSGHDNVVNNGADVGTTVTIPALDGLFLLDKNATLSTNEDKIKLGNQIRIYPNPTYNTLHIGLPENLKNKSLRASIYDINGRHIFSKEINTSNGKTMMPNTLQQGTYLLKISGQNFVQSKLIQKI